MTDPTPAAPAPVEAKAEMKVVPPAAKAPEPEPTEEYEIDGKKVQLTKTQARTHIQKHGAADKRLQEATEKQKRADALLKKLEEDPEAALRELGKDPEKIIAEHLAKKAKQALMTPEQIETERLKKERDDLRAENEKTQAEKKKAAEKEADTRNERATHEQLVALADKYGLDADPDVLEGLCDAGIELIEILGRAPTGDQVAQEYIRKENERTEAHRSKRLTKLTGKKLLEYLGNPTVEAVKAALAEMDAESLKAIPAPVAKKKAEAPVTRPRDEKGKYINESGFDRKFGL